MCLAGVRVRPRRRAAVSGARQGVRGRGLRAPPGPLRADVRHPLRVHAVAHPQGAAGLPARPVPGVWTKDSHVTSSGGSTEAIEPSDYIFLTNYFLRCETVFIEMLFHFTDSRK